MLEKIQEKHSKAKERQLSNFRDIQARARKYNESVDNFLLTKEEILIKNDNCDPRHLQIMNQVLGKEKKQQTAVNKLEKEKQHFVKLMIDKNY